MSYVAQFTDGIRLLCWLSLCIHKGYLILLQTLSEKLASKNLVLADIDSFVLSMIGDDKQRDYDTILKINNNIEL